MKTGAYAGIGQPDDVRLLDPSTWFSKLKGLDAVLAANENNILQMGQMDVALVKEDGPYGERYGRGLQTHDVKDPK